MLMVLLYHCYIAWKQNNRTTLMLSFLDSKSVYGLNFLQYISIIYHHQPAMLLLKTTTDY